MILCKHCGYQVFGIVTNCFLHDGSDAEFHYTGTESNGAMCFELPPEWCAADLSDEERMESIKCPRCRKFPFSESAGVDVQEVLCVVCWGRKKRMAETLRFDPKTYDWLQDHEWAAITVTKCDKCGMHYKPDLGHVCDKMPRLEFNRWIGNTEVHACPPRLVSMYVGEPNDSIDVSLWNEDADGKRWRFSIAYFKRGEEGYSLQFVGARPFLYVENERVPELWQALKEAQETLDAWFDRTEEE